MIHLIYGLCLLLCFSGGIVAFEADQDLADEILEDIRSKYGWKEGKNSDGTIISVARVEITANTNSPEFALVRVLAYEKAMHDALIQVARIQSGTVVESNSSGNTQQNGLELKVDFTSRIVESLPEGSFLQGFEVIRTGEHCPNEERCVAIAVARNDPQGYSFAQAAATGNSLGQILEKSGWSDYESLTEMSNEQLLYTQGVRKSLRDGKPVLLSMASAAVQFDTPSGLEIAKSMAEAKARQQISLFLESSVKAQSQLTGTLGNLQIMRDDKFSVTNDGTKQQMSDQSQIQTNSLIKNASRLRSVCGKHPLATSKTCLVILSWESRTHHPDIKSQTQDSSESDLVQPHRGREHVGIGL